MGGCASKPRDLDINQPAPVEAPAVDKTESDTIAQENNGGEETKKEEPLVDLSEPTSTEEPTKPTTEESVEVSETKTAEPLVEAEAKAEVKAEAQAEAKAEPAEVVVASEPEKAPEPVVVNKEEAKPIEAQKSEDKSDAPLVTM